MKLSDIVPDLILAENYYLRPTKLTMPGTASQDIQHVAKCSRNFVGGLSLAALYSIYSFVSLYLGLGKRWNKEDRLWYRTVQSTWILDKVFSHERVYRPLGLKFGLFVIILSKIATAAGAMSLSTYAIIEGRSTKDIS